MATCKACRAARPRQLGPHCSLLIIFPCCRCQPSSLHHQQTIDINVDKDEHVYFVTIDTNSIHLTGNYVESDHTHADDDEDYDSENEYDLSPNQDELDNEGTPADKLNSMVSKSKVLYTSLGWT